MIRMTRRPRLGVSNTPATKHYDSPCGPSPGCGRPRLGLSNTPGTKHHYCPVWPVAGMRKTCNTRGVAHPGDRRMCATRHVLLARQPLHDPHDPDRLPTRPPPASHPPTPRSAHTLFCTNALATSMSGHGSACSLAFHAPNPLIHHGAPVVSNTGSVTFTTTQFFVTQSASSSSSFIVSQ